jgi:hypothetical protein
VIEGDAALLGIIGVIIGALLSQRGARRVAGEDRLWARRADLYLSLLDWLRDDLALFHEGEPRHKRPWAVQAGLEAFGTEHLDRALAGYDEARASATAGHPNGRQQVLLRANWLRLTIRHELAALPARGERIGLGIVSNRFVYGPVTRLAAYAEARRMRRALAAEENNVER